LGIAVEDRRRDGRQAAGPAEAIALGGAVCTQKVPSLPVDVDLQQV
jgi:hypothetical protein